jgi:hypothetical protein
LLFLKEEFGEDGARQQLKLYANQVMDDYAVILKKIRYRAVRTFYILASWKIIDTIHIKMRK